MKVGRWSTTAGNNNATPPDGWPEGQAPSTVNDCAREMMASIRTMVADMQYIDQDFTPTFINATSFSVPGNQTSAIHAGRRLKLFDTNTIYGTVSTASFTTVTTINISADTGSLTSSLSSFALSILSSNNNAIPRNQDLVLGSLTVNGSAVISGSLIAVTTLTVGNTLTVQGACIVGSVLSANSVSAPRVFLGNGSAAFPSLTFYNDGAQDTGFYWGGDGYTNFTNNGVYAGQIQPGGHLVMVGNVTAFSDPRLKKDWRDLPSSFLEELAEVQTGTFTRVDIDQRQVGVNAQDLKEFLPEAVQEGEYLSVAYGNAALAACVELAKEVLSLRARLNALEKGL